MKQLAFVAVGALSVISCGGSTTQPTVIEKVIYVPVSSSDAPPPQTLPPTALLKMTIDSGAVVGLARASTVHFDGTFSTGSQLSYQFDFGDGSPKTGLTTTPSIDHTYQRPGQYTATLQVSDRTGRQAAESVTVRVVEPCGDWMNSILNRANAQTERRRLTLHCDDSLNLTGTYTHPEGWTTPVTGRLLPARGISITLTDGTISFTGSPVDGFDPAANSLKLTVRGGSADGQQLYFETYCNTPLCYY